MVGQHAGCAVVQHIDKVVVKVVGIVVKQVGHIAGRRRIRGLLTGQRRNKVLIKRRVTAKRQRLLKSSQRIRSPAHVFKQPCLLTPGSRQFGAQVQQRVKSQQRCTVLVQPVQCLGAQPPGVCITRVLRQHVVASGDYIRKAPKLLEHQAALVSRRYRLRLQAQRGFNTRQRFIMAAQVRQRRATVQQSIKRGCVACQCLIQLLQRRARLTQLKQRCTQVAKR